MVFIFEQRALVAGYTIQSPVMSIRFFDVDEVLIVGRERSALLKMHPDFYAHPVQVIEHGDPRRDGWVTPLRVFLVDDEGRVDKYDRAGICVATYIAASVRTWNMEELHGFSNEGPDDPWQFQITSEVLEVEYAIRRTAHPRDRTRILRCPVAY